MTFAAINTKDLNVLDIVAIGVALLTLLITYVLYRKVKEFDERDAVNTLLWDITREHWRTAYSLLDNLEPRHQIMTNEGRELRRAMLQRTIRQIRAIDGQDSPLARAFGNVHEVRVEEWIRQPTVDGGSGDGGSEWPHLDDPTESNEQVVRDLTLAIAERFGSAKVRDQIKRQEAQIRANQPTEQQCAS